MLYLLIEQEQGHLYMQSNNWWMYIHEHVLDCVTLVVNIVDTHHWQAGSFANLVIILIMAGNSKCTVRCLWQHNFLNWPSTSMCSNGVSTWWSLFCEGGVSTQENHATHVDNDHTTLLCYSSAPLGSLPTHRIQLTLGGRSWTLAQ